jgi:NTE family protein
MTATTGQPPGFSTADFVLEGGGVRGIALIGALLAFDRRGIGRYRIAGVSAGAIVGSLVAAGIPLTALGDAYLGQDYRALLDGTWLRRLPVPVINKWVSIYFLKGQYKGEALRRWIGERLSDPPLLHGAPPLQTWGQLKFDDPDADHHIVVNAELVTMPDHYRLVVISNDVTRGPMMRFPWDYGYWYNLDPDAQSVADAVYWSAAVPGFFLPGKLTSNLTGQTSNMVDGGISNGFPVDIFDRHDGVPPRWPTFYIGLQTRRDPRQPVERPDRSGLSYWTDQVLWSAIDGRNATELADPTRRPREVLVPANDVDPLDFGISRQRQEALFQLGADTANRFLDTFSWPDYLEQAKTRPIWSGPPTRATQPAQG